MSSLRGLIGECWEELLNGVAWICLYKEGRSWQAGAFYPESGDYEDGFVLSKDDYEEIERICGIDHKAICVNGYYMGFGRDFTLKELENKILWFYETRLHQLKEDFLDGYVIPPKTSNEKGISVNELLTDAGARCGVLDEHSCDKRGVERVLG